MLCRASASKLRSVGSLAVNPTSWQNGGLRNASGGIGVAPEKVTQSVVPAAETFVSWKAMATTGAGAGLAFISITVGSIFASYHALNGKVDTKVDALRTDVHGLDKAVTALSKDIADLSKKLDRRGWFG